MSDPVLIFCQLCERNKPLSWSQDAAAVRRSFPAAFAASDPTRGRVCADCLGGLISRRQEQLEAGSPPAQRPQR